MASKYEQETSQYNHYLLHFNSYLYSRLNKAFMLIVQDFTDTTFQSLKLILDMYRNMCDQTSQVTNKK